MRAMRPRAILLLVAIAASGACGCRWNNLPAGVVSVRVVEGVSVLDFDGLNVHVRRDKDDAERYLVSGGSLVRELFLRPGDGFVITNGRQRHDAYFLLKADEEWITLKRKTMIQDLSGDEATVREAARTDTDVIAVKPYNHEKKD